MSKKVLITGIAGFIGTNLYLEIQSRYPDWKIYGLDNFFSGSINNLKWFKGSFFCQDLRDPQFILDLKGVEFDYIFHLAANSSTTDYDAISQTTNNIESFRNILTLASFKKIPVIWTSSASVYGKTQHVVTTQARLNPDSPYAISKMLCENLQREVAVFDAAWKLIGIRPFNVYGPHEEGKDKMASMVTQLLKQMMRGDRPKIFTNGEQSRDFIYVKDLVDLMLFCATQKDLQGSHIFNGGTGLSLSFNQLVRGINHVLGSNLEPEYIDNPHSHYQDFTQANMTRVNALGWNPKYFFRSAIKEMVEVIDKDRVTKK